MKLMKVEYLRGYIEDRLDLLKQTHKHSIEDSDYRIQMMSRIDELNLVLKEIETLEHLEK